MTELVLWRHGQTDYNAQMRVQGQIDIPLNSTGLEQARAAAAGIAALGPARIVCSPLSRARQTAQALAGLTGLVPEREDSLVERAFGQWEGLTRQEVSAGWPEQAQAWLRGQDPVGVGVETRAETAQRVGGALERIMAQAEQEGQEVVVVVGHGSATTLGTSHLLAVDPSTWSGLRGMDNCHYAVVRRSQHHPGWRLVAWNVG